MGFDNYSEALLVADLLSGKDQNYKLAYLVALKYAESGSEKGGPAATFGYMLEALDQADKQRKQEKP